MAAIAAKFGQPLMPWQQLVADIGLELRPDGLPAYREIIVTVPRQNGKTTLILAWELDRALGWGRRQLIIYSAQTGKDARQKLIDDHWPLLEHSPFAAAIVKLEQANGREGILFKGGSHLLVVSDSESAGHGKTIGLGVVDEAFKDVDNRREQALKPAMITVPDAQLIVASTQGTDASIYLNRKIDTGRDIAVADSDDARTAYFEWSAPDDADPDDPTVWRDCMPALGITISEEDVRAERETMLDGDFRRAFLNQRTSADERVIPDSAWSAVCDPRVEPDGTITFGVDCNPERTDAAIVAVDNQGRAELVEHERGTGWLVNRTVELARKWKASVALDVGGPAGGFAADIVRAGIPVIECTGRNFAHACSLFYDAVADQKLRVRTHAGLNAAVAAARRRTSGDAWAWARKDATVDLSPLVALTVGYWAAANHEPPKAGYIPSTDL